MNHFIPYSPTPTEPWLTEASGNQGESRDVTKQSRNTVTNPVNAIILNSRV